jgi:thermitase
MVRVALIASSLLVLAGIAPAAQAATGETEIIIARDPGLSGSERAEIRQDAGVAHVRNLRLPDTEVVRTDDPRAALAALRRDPDVHYAEVNRTRRALTNDSYFKYQWALSNTGQAVPTAEGGTAAGTSDADMDVPEAWSHGTLGQGVTVAVVDSGIDATHPELAGQVAGAHGFVGGVPSDTTDNNGHGTHVSGIIAAVSNNSAGISGIAPGARLLALKALDGTPEASGSDDDIADAFSYAGDHGVRIVSASLGGIGTSTTLTNSIRNHPHTLYVLAAGNSNLNNDSVNLWPCNAPAPNIVCVGSSDENDVRSGFSDYGRATVDLFAPGSDILSLWPDPDPSNGYAVASGTSMATPAVAAEAALVLSAQPSLSTAQLKGILLGAVDAKPAFAGISVTGGRANADVAVQRAAGTAPDSDDDGVPNASDHCPTQPAATSNGCPAPVTTTPNPTQPTTTTPVVTTPVNTGDRDSDGRADPLDACPDEAANTPNGCPRPTVRTVSVKVRKHRARVRVHTDRSATVAMKVERRMCNSHGKKCKWRMAYSNAKLSSRNAASFTSRKLRRGKYRVSVRLSSPAGNAKLFRTKSFTA